MASIDLTHSDDESPQITCDRCTLLNPADAQRCGACNSPLATQDGPPPPKRPRPSSSPSIKEMKAAIREAGLGVADLLEKSDVEARYAQAQVRLAEAERRRSTTPAPTTSAPAVPPGARGLFFRVESSGGRLRAALCDGAVRPPSAGFTRHFCATRVVDACVHPRAPPVPVHVTLAYDGDAQRVAAWKPPPAAYRQSGALYANGASLGMSQLQKAVRREDSEVAAKAALELLTLRRSGGLSTLLRRLIVISCEDSMPLQGVTPELVWLLLAACGDDAAANYKLTVSDVAFVLGAASAIAACPLGPARKAVPVEFLADVPRADVSQAGRDALCLIIAVAACEMSDGDRKHVLCGACYFAMSGFPALTSAFAPRLPSSVGRLRPEQCILEGVDGRCGAFGKPLAPIWNVMFEIDPSLKAVGFRELEDWMQRKRSWVNTHYGFESARSHQPDWHRVADAAAERIIAEAVLKRPPW